MITEHGPSVGTFKDKPIPAYIVTDRGERFEFARIGEIVDGGFEMSQMSRDECVIAPGLIYRPAINGQGPRNS